MSSRSIVSPVFLGCVEEDDEDDVVFEGTFFPAAPAMDPPFRDR